LCVSFINTSHRSILMPKINYTEEDLEDHNGMGAVIKDDKGQILVQEHVKYGFWTLPVGKAKKDSDVKEGLKKELLEECGINAVKFREIAKRDYYYTRNKRKVLVMVHLFEIEKYEGIIENREPEKHRKQLFMGLKEIVKLPYLSDITLFYLETLGIKRKAKLK